MLAGFAVVITEAVFSFWKRVHAINFGIYGAARVGKTTLNHQLRTRGEVPDIKKRTQGLHRSTRKVVKIDGDAHTVKTADVGGESIYWKEWVKDMRRRKVRYIIFMIDDRHFIWTKYGNIRFAWKYLV